MKPSLGRVPMGGLKAPGWADLSTKGPMARTIRDITLALDAVVGPEATDLRSLPMPEASWTRSLEELHAPRKVGWAPTLGYAEVDREVAAICVAAVERLADLGTEIVEVDPVFPEDPVRGWLTLAMAGNERALGHLRGTDDWDRLDPGHAARSTPSDARSPAPRCWPPLTPATTPTSGSSSCSTGCLSSSPPPWPASPGR